MLRFFAKAIAVSFLATLLAANFLCPLYAQDDASKVEKKVNAQISEFVSTVRELIPEGSNPGFDVRVNYFLQRYESYLNKYYMITVAMDDVVGPDAIQDINDILKETLGFTTKDLDKEAQELYDILNYKIIPTLKVKIEQDISHEFKSGSYEKKYEGMTLSAIVGKVDKNLSKQEQTYLKYKDKILKNAQINLSKKAKSYVNTINNPDNNTQLNPENFWGFLLFDEVLQYAEQDLEAKRAEEELRSIQGEKKLIKDLVQITELPSLSQEEKQKREAGARMYLFFLEEQRTPVYKQIDKMMSKSTMLKGQVGSAINMYLAITVKDLFNVATNGRFLEDKYKTLYVGKDGQKYTYGEFWEDTFSKYIDIRNEPFYRTHIPFASFVVSAQVTRYVLSKNFVNKFYNVFDRTVYGYGGKLLRGFAGYSISMGVGMWTSELVGQRIMLRNELSSDNPQIKALANNIISETSFSDDSLRSVIKSVTAFGISDVAISITKSVPAYYSKMKKLNKNKCKYSYQDILDKVKNNRIEKSTAKGLGNSRLGRFSKRLGHESLIFIGAQFAENYLLWWMFEDSLGEHEKELEKYHEELQKLEIELLTEKLLNTDGETSGLDKVYNELDGYMFLSKIIDGLRTETALLHNCFRYEDTESCISSVYLKILDPKSVDWKQFLYSSTPDRVAKDDLKKNILNVSDKIKATMPETKKLKESIQNNPDFLDKIVEGNLTKGKLLLINQAEKKLGKYIENSDLERARVQLQFVFELINQAAKDKITTVASPEVYVLLDRTITDELQGLNNLSCEQTIERLKRLFKQTFKEVLISEEESTSLNGQYMDLRELVLQSIAFSMFSRIEAVCSKNKESSLQKIYDVKDAILFNPNCSDIVKQTVLKSFEHKGLPSTQGME